MAPQASALKKVSVVIPCHNEAGSIGAVVDQLPYDKLSAAGYAVEIIVVDNNCTDETAAVATAHGARVICESKQGKGNAIRAGFQAVSDDSDYVVMLDGDGTYRSAEILRLLEPIESGFCDVVSGSRLAGKMTEDSMRGFNRLGNWFFSFLIRYVYRVNITDTLTGYLAWRSDVVVQLRPHIVSEGFALEMELITKMAKMGYTTYSVPITYAPRVGDSHLHPVRDGLRILGMFARQLMWEPFEHAIEPVVEAAQPLTADGNGNGSGKRATQPSLATHAVERRHTERRLSRQWVAHERRSGAERRRGLSGVPSWTAGFSEVSGAPCIAVGEP
jgi:hypothetical protein